MARKLVVVGGARPQARKASARSWSKTKARAFLGVLAETCNVSEASRQSGISLAVAYRRRRSDAAFRAAWVDAIALAYQRLELVLLDRAFNGTEKLVARKDGSEARMREYSDQLGLRLLKMHRETAAEAEVELPPDQVEELRQKLFSKLRRLKQRDGQGRDEGA